MLRSVITGPSVCRRSVALASSSAQLGRLVSYSTIPSAGGDSFDGGHVLVTEQEQGNIQQRIQEAASQVDLDSIKQDTRWIHFNETMADLIVRESLEALKAERDAEIARRTGPKLAPGCGVDSHAHDCCCGGGEDEVGAPGTDVEPAGKATGGAQA